MPAVGRPERPAAVPAVAFIVARIMFDARRVQAAVIDVEIGNFSGVIAPFIDFTSVISGKPAVIQGTVRAAGTPASGFTRSRLVTNNRGRIV